MDPILCLITSKTLGDGFDVCITKADFASGGLSIDSVVRPCHLFTLDSKMIDYTAGRLKPTKLNEVTTKLIEILTT